MHLQTIGEMVVKAVQISTIAQEPVLVDIPMYIINHTRLKQPYGLIHITKGSIGLNAKVVEAR